ncbi:hypothetical protein AgCh_008165 [Apium graveolens]
MDPTRRSSRVIDPKFRQVGFFAPQPDHTLSGPFDSPPVMIPPPRRAYGDVTRAIQVPVGEFDYRRSEFDFVRIGSYDPSDSMSSLSSRIGDGEFSEDSGNWIRGKLPMSLPSSGFDRAVRNLSKKNLHGLSFEKNGVPPAELSLKSDLNPLKEKTTKAERRALQETQRAAKAAGKGLIEKNGDPPAQMSMKSDSVPLQEKTTKAERRALQEAQRAVKACGKGSSEKNGDLPAEMSMKSDSKPRKDITTKAERRALQEAQRAAKAAGKGLTAEGKLSAAATGKEASVQIRGVKHSRQKKDVLMASSEKTIGDRPPEKDRKKEVPTPRMQFDDKSRVEKAKKHSVVKQVEARNRVDFFLHLPQYERGTQLPDLETKFFQLKHIHPAVYKIGLQYLAGDVCGANSRCIAMLQAFQKAIEDYSAPLEKTVNRDLIAKINSYVSFLIECRPLSVSMGNAIRFLKAHVTKLPPDISESEAKASISSDIDRFITEKIVLADRIIVKHAVTKIRDGDVLLTYGSSSVVEMILLQAHELGKIFRVVVVDSRPKLEGQALVRRLVRNGVSCTYTHINAISYIMHEITKVFLGAASVLSNGTVYSRIGTACVAMVAHEYRVPVMICCEAYKFHERVQLDSVCCNELDDPRAVSKVPGEVDIHYLDDSVKKNGLQHLNLL